MTSFRIPRIGHAFRAIFPRGFGRRAVKIWHAGALALAMTAAVWLTRAQALSPALPAQPAGVGFVDPDPEIQGLRLIAPEAQIAPPPAPQVLRGGRRLQCAIYARERSGIVITGDARTWWEQAAGRYRRAATPAQGAVLVMGGTRGGHVAVVAQVVSDREILIDHANWLNRGEVELGALARDVSPLNDWSQIQVWHAPTKRLGLRRYPVFGFILPEPIPSGVESYAASGRYLRPARMRASR